MGRNGNRSALAGTLKDGRYDAGIETNADYCLVVAALLQNYQFLPRLYIIH